MITFWDLKKEDCNNDDDDDDDNNNNNNNNKTPTTKWTWTMFGKKCLSCELIKG